MRIFEIASHGIAGMPPGRIQLPPGHVVLPGAGAFPGLLVETLQSREIGGPAGALSGPWFSVILDGPGGIFRLVRGVSGPTSVEVWEPQARSFQALPFDPDPSSTVAEAIGWPVADGSFVVSGADGPSRRESTGSREERIERLEAELAILDAVDVLQERLDGIGYQLAQLEGERSELERLRNANEQAASRLAAFAAWSEIPDDAGGVQGVEAELMRFRAATAEKEQQLARIEAEREQDRHRVETLPAHSLPGDRWFWAGVVGGVVFLSLGLASPWPVLALFDIPLFGLAALRALGAVGRHQARTGFERRKLLFAEREKRVEAQWWEATRDVAQWMQLVGVETPEALVARLAERRQAHVDTEAAVQVLRERERVFGGDAAGRLEALRQESGRLEGELGAALAGAYRSRQEVESELDAVRHGGRAEVGPEVRLLERVATRMGGDTAAVAGWLLPRASEFLAWLTEGALGALMWEGGLWAVGPEGGRSIDDIPPPEREPIWLSLLFAVLEARDPASSVPVILDDPFGPLPNRERIGPLLKGLGQRTQIVHCTDTGGWAEWADAVAATRAA